MSNHLYLYDNTERPTEIPTSDNKADAKADFARRIQLKTAYLRANNVAVQTETRTFSRGSEMVALTGHDHEGHPFGFVFILTELVLV